jgi:23S rRNA (adenine2503-C2)-methyltransferase
MISMLGTAGRDDLARVFLGEFASGRYAEFVEALQPPHPQEEKWVLLLSVADGCPGGCAFCDAGGFFRGHLSAGEILAQADYLVERRYPDRRVTAKKFKVQFARMGDPALNPAVLDALEALPLRYDAPGLLASLSTVAPEGRDAFFERLIAVKDQWYSGGRFQMQFSIHSLDPAERDRLVPIRKWGLDAIAAYGRRFRRPGDRKVTLNFALTPGAALEPGRLAEHFDADSFLVKLTPVNPTLAARDRGVGNLVEDWSSPAALDPIAAPLRAAGFEVIVSPGEFEENRIGSNCGQFLRAFLEGRRPPQPEAYAYPVRPLRGDGGEALVRIPVPLV